jgi:phosphohistidine phosphatase SixA
VRRLGLRVSAVLTSAFCRTRETARLAFGHGTVTPALLNTITAAHDARWQAQIRAVRRLLGSTPAPRTIKVLVTHGIVVSDATRLTLDEGETLVLRPLGSSRFKLLGRILPREWRTLAAG